MLHFKDPKEENWPNFTLYHFLVPSLVVTYALVNCSNIGNINIGMSWWSDIDIHKSKIRVWIIIPLCNDLIPVSLTFPVFCSLALYYHVFRVEVWVYQHANKLNVGLLISFVTLQLKSSIFWILLKLSSSKNIPCSIFVECYMFIACFHAEFIILPKYPC